MYILDLRILFVFIFCIILIIISVIFLLIFYVVMLLILAIEDNLSVLFAVVILPLLFDE